MPLHLLVVLAISPVLINKGQGQYIRSCGDGVFCPSYAEGGEVMCCRGDVLVREGGLFFDHSCCTVDKWLEEEVRSRGEILWPGNGEGGLGVVEQEQGDATGPAIAEFQGEGGLVEGRDVQSFLQVLTVGTEPPEDQHEITAGLQTSMVIIQQEVSESQQDRVDVVEDIEDKLDEVEEQQKSIRETVHRVTSWNEVVKRPSFLLQAFVAPGVQSPGGFPTGGCYCSPRLSSLSPRPLLLLQAPL